MVGLRLLHTCDPTLPYHRNRKPIPRFPLERVRTVRPLLVISFLQSALLYTTSCGERRIRVHNIAVPVEQVVQNVFDSVNIDVLCNILAKQALEVSCCGHGAPWLRGRC